MSKKILWDEKAEDLKAKRMAKSFGKWMLKNEKKNKWLFKKGVKGAK